MSTETFSGGAVKRPTSKVTAPPGGRSSIDFGAGSGPEQPKRGKQTFAKPQESPLKPAPASGKETPRLSRQLTDKHTSKPSRDSPFSKEPLPRTQRTTQNGTLSKDSPFNPSSQSRIPVRARAPSLTGSQLNTNASHPLNTRAEYKAPEHVRRESASLSSSAANPLSGKNHTPPPQHRARRPSSSSISAQSTRDSPQKVAYKAQAPPGGRSSISFGSSEPTGRTETPKRSNSRPNVSQPSANSPFNTSTTGPPKYDRPPSRANLMSDSNPFSKAPEPAKPAPKPAAPAPWAKPTNTPPRRPSITGSYSRDSPFSTSASGPTHTRSASNASASGRQPAGGRSSYNILTGQ